MSDESLQNSHNSLEDERKSFELDSNLSTACETQSQNPRKDPLQNTNPNAFEDNDNRSDKTNLLDENYHSSTIEEVALLADAKRSTENELSENTEAEKEFVEENEAESFPTAVEIKKSQEANDRLYETMLTEISEFLTDLLEENFPSELLATAERSAENEPSESSEAEKESPESTEMGSFPVTVETKKSKETNDVLSEEMLIDTKESADIFIDELSPKDEELGDTLHPNGSELSMVDPHLEDAIEWKPSKDSCRSREFRISPRLEYLARPRKDIIQKFAEKKCKDDSEDNLPISQLAFPSSKIPYIPQWTILSRQKLAHDLFIDIKDADFDLRDGNNLCLPQYTYECLHDPGAKGYLEKVEVRKQLLRHKLINGDDRVMCSLKDLNKYREYQRRVMAAEVEQKLKQEDEEFRKKRDQRKKAALKKDLEKYNKMRDQGVMRRSIKNLVKSIKESSMEKQRRRDMRVLNCQIRAQQKQKERAAAKEDDYHRLYFQHLSKKYGERKEKDKILLEMAKRDMERLEKLCLQQKEKEEQTKKDKEEFYKRKFEFQKAWIARGLELEQKFEQEKKENIEMRKKAIHSPKGMKVKDDPEAAVKVSREERLEDIWDKRDELKQDAQNGEPDIAIKELPVNENEDQLDKTRNFREDDFLNSQEENTGQIENGRDPDETENYGEIENTETKPSREDAFQYIDNDDLNKIDKDKWEKSNYTENGLEDHIKAQYENNEHPDTTHSDIE